MSVVDIDPAAAPGDVEGAAEGIDTSLRARWAGVLLILCAVLAGPIGYAGQLGYAALMGVVGIASLPMLGVRRAPMWGFLALVGLVLWAAISMAWSVDAPNHTQFHTYKQAEQLTALKLVFELALYGAFAFLMRDLTPRWATWAMLALSLSLALCALVMSIDAVTDAGVHRWARIEFHAADKPEIVRRNAARGCYTVALLFWPVALWLLRTHRPRLLLLLVVTFGVAALGLRVDAPIAAVVLGGAAFLAIRQFGRPAVWALLAATIAYFALGPIMIDLTGPYLPHLHDGEGIAKESWGARIEIWRFTTRHIIEHPVIGWGIDASRDWPDKIPLHPHNAALQLWLELGAVGAALGALFLTFVWRRIGETAERSRTDAGIGAATLVAYLTIGALSFGVWQEWWLGLGGLTAGMIAVDAVARVNERARARKDDFMPMIE